MSLERPAWEEAEGRRAQEWPADEAVVIRHEEEPELLRERRTLGFLRARRKVETLRAKADLPAELEALVEERVPAAPDDSGKVETLPDGSISIPVYREELVVTKRTVLSERVIIRKQVRSRRERVEADLLVEHVEVEADEGVEVSETRAGAPAPPPERGA